MDKSKAQLKVFVGWPVKDAVVNHVKSEKKAGNKEITIASFTTLSLIRQLKIEQKWAEPYEIPKDHLIAWEKCKDIPVINDILKRFFLTEYGVNIEELGK